MNHLENVVFLSVQLNQLVYLNKSSAGKLFDSFNMPPPTYSGAHDAWLIALGCPSECQGCQFFVVVEAVRLPSCRQSCCWSWRVLLLGAFFIVFIPGALWRVKHRKLTAEILLVLLWLRRMNKDLGKYLNPSQVYKGS